MAKVNPYHSAVDSNEPHKKYHDHDDCSIGREIKEEDRIEGTGGRAHCTECQRLPA